MPELALVLFLPWFLVLAALYCAFPRQPRGALRRAVDVAVLVTALLLSVWAMRFGYRHADPDAGAIWKQVLATLLGYGAFLGVLAVGWPLRHALMRPRSNGTGREKRRA